MKQFKNHFVFISISILIVCTYVNAQWSTDPYINTPVCTKYGDQVSPSITYVGNGCTVIAWKDLSGPHSIWGMGWGRIYAQKFSASGEPLWGAQGIRVFDADDKGYSSPHIVSDGLGGAIITCSAHSEGYPFLDDLIMAQRISNNGKKLWGENGIYWGRFFFVGGDEHEFEWINIVPDKNNGALISCLISYSYSGFPRQEDYYILRIDSKGNVKYKTSVYGIEVFYSFDTGESFTDDGLGGAIIVIGACENNLIESYKIEATIVDSTGQTFKQCVVCQHDSSLYYPKVVSDGAGGGIIVWFDRRSQSVYNNVELYAQRIDNNCVPQWTTNGIPIVEIDTCTSVCGHVTAAPVENGGAVFAWKEVNTENIHSTYLRAQRLDNNGERLWGENGLCWQIGSDYNSNHLIDYSIINDFTDKFILGWIVELQMDGRVIKSVKLNHDGSSIWYGNICHNENSFSENLSMAPDGAGGAVMTWIDKRNENSDIYAQQINNNGELGILKFPIHSILVIGEDRSDNNLILKSFGYNVRYEQSVTVLDTMNLSGLDQIWYSEVFELPEASGRTNLMNFVLAGGRIFFEGDSYKDYREAFLNWRDSFLNNLGAGGISQFPNPLSYPDETLFNTNPVHSISNITFKISAVGHGSGGYGIFENIGNGTTIVEDQRIGKPVAIAFDYGDLTNTPGSRAVIYLNSNNTTNWAQYAANIAYFLGSKQQPIVLTVKDSKGVPGLSGKVKIDMENFQNVAGVQFTLTDTPELLTVDSVYTGNRVSEFITSFNEDTTGGLIVILFSTTGSIIYPGTGTIAEIIYSVSDSAAIGDSINIRLSKSMLSDLKGQSIPVTTVDGFLYLGTIKGDVNNDGIVDILDLVRTVNIILYILPVPTASELEAADCNEDSEVDILDVVCIMNIILGIEPNTNGLLAKTENLNTIELLDVDFVAGEKVEVPVLSNFSDDIAGLQLNINYNPENLIISEPDASSRTSEMILVSHDKNGELIILVYSLDGKIIKSGEGTILTIPVEVKTNAQVTNSLHLENVILSSPDAQNISIEIVSKVGDGVGSMPRAFSLYQNYPNPFNTETVIKYELPKPSEVNIKVFNLLGQEIKNLVYDHKEAGFHAINWDGQDDNKLTVASGIYVYQLQAGDFCSRKKLIILK